MKLNFWDNDYIKDFNSKDISKELNILNDLKKYLFGIKPQNPENVDGHRISLLYNKKTR